MVYRIHSESDGTIVAANVFVDVRRDPRVVQRVNERLGPHVGSCIVNGPIRHYVCVVLRLLRSETVYRMQFLRALGARARVRAALYALPRVSIVSLVGRQLAQRGRKCASVRSGVAPFHIPGELAFAVVVV